MSINVGPDSDSLENNTNQFLTLEGVKKEKEIPDDLSDNILEPLVSKTNNHMTDLLTPVIDLIDLSSTKFFNKAADVAFTYFDYLYTRKVLKLYTEAHEIKVEFDQDVKVFLKAIQSQPKKAARSQIASASSSYESRLTKNIPGLTDEEGNLIDEFGSIVRTDPF